MKHRSMLSLPALLAALIITGCGGGSGDGSSTSSAASSSVAASSAASSSVAASSAASSGASSSVATVKLSGTAATGAPVVSGNVSVKCGAAAAVTTTTGTNGAWSADVGNQPAYPCLVAVTGGSLAAGTTLYGYATSATNVNVTPLTSLIGAYATNAANGAPITQAMLNAAVTKASDLLVAAGLGALPSNPLTATFSPKAGDPYDDYLEALMATLAKQSISLAKLVDEVTKQGAPVTTAIESPNVVAFDSTPAVLPAHVISYGAEAYQLTGLGDRIALATNTPRALRSVTVVMDSWACQSGDWSTGNCVSAANASFQHPVTINIYSDSGTLLATRTQDFAIPYRPSTSSTCTGGKWMSPEGCKNGVAFKIDFDLRSLKVTLPDIVRYEVSYNTNTNGPAPLHKTGPYDSLNIGVYDVAVSSPSVGTDKDLGYLLWNKALSNTYDPTDTSRYGLLVKFVVGTP
ncbi:MAG TPA: hypothetical protein VLC92_04320 [Rhodocyclaceae bacterium]|nr:hypothetical protein [Rhodocyclaceae bacterium]